MILTSKQHANFALQSTCFLVKIHNIHALDLGAIIFFGFPLKVKIYNCFHSEKIFLFAGMYRPVLKGLV